MGKKSLEEAITLHEAKLEYERKEGEGRQRAFERQRRAARKREEELTPQKLELATEIFDWAKAFVQTPLYNRLLAWSNRFGGHGRGVFVFGAGWGHEDEYNGGYGCWSRVHVRDDGALQYKAGYKYMPSGPTIWIADADDLSRKLCYEYLKRFSDTIKTEDVYKKIEVWYFRKGI